MYDAGFVAIDGWILSDCYYSKHDIYDAYRTYCHLLLYDTFVIDLWYLLTTDIAS